MEGVQGKVEADELWDGAKCTEMRQTAVSISKPQCVLNWAKGDWKWKGSMYSPVYMARRSGVFIFASSWYGLKLNVLVEDLN